MIDLNYNRRFKEANSIDHNDYIYYDNGTQILQRISYSDFKTNTFNGILDGGVNNIDEDVPQLIGGFHGISKNSNTINNG
jgi:hypothetical protein